MPVRRLPRMPSSRNSLRVFARATSSRPRIPQFLHEFIEPLRMHDTPAHERPPAAFAVCHASARAILPAPASGKYQPPRSGDRRVAGALSLARVLAVPGTAAGELARRNEERQGSAGAARCLLRRQQQERAGGDTRGLRESLRDAFTNSVWRLANAAGFPGG